MQKAVSHSPGRRETDTSSKSSKTYIVHCDLGLVPGVGRKPEVDSVQATNTELEGRDGHGEAAGTARRLEGELVGLSSKRGHFQWFPPRYESSIFVASRNGWVRGFVTRPEAVQRAPIQAGGGCFRSPSKNDVSHHISRRSSLTSHHCPEVVTTRTPFPRTIDVVTSGRVFREHVRSRI